MPERDRSRLPKWAQQEIQRLERDLAWYKKKLAEGPQESDTFADPFSDAPRPLGKGTMIEFVAGDRQKFRVRLDRGELEINADDSINVQPWASNMVYIEIKER